MMKSNPNSAPSDYMFTKLSAFGAVQRSFDILTGDLCTFLTLGLLVVPVMVLVMVLYFAFIMPTGTTTTNTYSSNNFDYSSSTNGNEEISPGAIIALTIICCCVLIPVAFLSTAAIIRATAEIYAGERPQVGAVLQVGVRNICRLFCFGFVLLVPLLGLSLVGGLMIGLVIATMNSGDGNPNTATIILGLVLFPVWFSAYIFVMVPFQMAPPSLVLERSSVTGVVTRAWELASGRRLTIFLATLILGLINFVVGLIPIVNIFWHLLALPLSSILPTVLFLSLRAEKEGLSRSGLRGELGMDLADETELVAEAYADENPSKGGGEHFNIV